MRPAGPTAWLISDSGATRSTGVPRVHFIRDVERRARERGFVPPMPCKDARYTLLIDLCGAGRTSSRIAQKFGLSLMAQWESLDQGAGMGITPAARLRWSWIGRSASRVFALNSPDL